MIKPPAVAGYVRDESGGWLVKAGPCTAYGRTLAKARTAIVKEVAGALDRYPGSVVLEDDVRVSPRASDALAAARKKKAAALLAAAESAAATADAARMLVADGLSLRDCAYLLGLSHARVQQLVKD